MLSQGGVERADDVVIAASVDEAVRVAASTGAEQAFITGGATIYEQYLDRADQMIIIEIPGEYDGDTRFPEWSQEAWKVTEHSPLGSELAVAIYERR